MNRWIDLKDGRVSYDDNNVSWEEGPEDLDELANPDPFW